MLIGKAQNQWDTTLVIPDTIEKPVFESEFSSSACRKFGFWLEFLCQNFFLADGVLLLFYTTAPLFYG